MYEVFRDWDSAKVGLVDQLLKQAELDTVLRNWTGSNITSVPIPYMFPNVCVLTEEDCARARKIVVDYFNAESERQEAWQCPNCGETVDGVFSECWACQTSSPAT
jgi:hypothetical protein